MTYPSSVPLLRASTEANEVAEWFPYNPDWPADFQEQADAYEAVFRAISYEEFCARA